MSNIHSLYIHIPFCKCICSYCDFYKMVAKDELKTKYISYLVKELEMKKNYFSDIKTIYIGGGTPSSLQIHLLDFLFYHLSRFINLKTVEEFTFEANPNDITLELVNILKKYHVNRISLGVQSFKPDKLKVLNRTHQEDDVKKAMELLKQQNIDNINIDLIYGVGIETFSDIKEDIDKAIFYGAKHLSTYSLILEERTLLHHLYDKDRFALMDDELESEIYHKLKSYLKQKGFIHYEISNFAKNSYQSKHNFGYWDNMNYIGAGAASSYYIDSTRYTNVKNLNLYFTGIDQNELIYEEKTVLTIHDQMNEHLMLGLRKIEGININDFEKRFNKNVFEIFPFINNLISNNLLQLKNNFLYIPEDKLYLSNEVFVNFI